MFATSDIGKGEYLFEYETARVYHPSKKAKYVADYERNGEGSYLLETQYGQKLVFDATRALHTLGRYVNHSSTHTNCRYWRALYICGKWRVGFVVTHYCGR